VLDKEFESIQCQLIDGVMESLVCSACTLGYPPPFSHEEGNEEEGHWGNLQGAYYFAGVCKGKDLHMLHAGVEDGFLGHAPYKFPKT